MRSSILFTVAMLVGSACWAASDFPNKPVHIVVPYGPGGTSDLTARVISQQLGDQLKESFVVDNRPGATGAIGYGTVARSPADGYTLALVDTGFAMLPAVNKSLPFDVVKDFTPVTQVMGVPMVLVVNPQLGVSTLQEFVALARANPGKLNYGSGGTGGVNHLAAELFKTAAGVDIKHIPYKGAGDMSTALLGGQIQMMLTSIPSVRSFVENGRMRALAVTTDGKRSTAMPDVPSMSEAGVAGMGVYTWFGLVGPAGLPQDVVLKLQSEVSKALQAPTVRDAYVKQGGELVGSAPEDFSKHIATELRRWDDAVKAAGIKGE